MISFPFEWKPVPLHRWNWWAVGFVAFLSLAATNCVQGQEAPLHLKRSVDSISVVEMEISTETAHYKPIFGSGDADAEVAKGVRRYGQLTVDPQGSSRSTAYEGEELVYYVLEGTGMLGYAGQEVPISQDDFFYVPAGTSHRFANPREAPLKVMAMGFAVDDSLGPSTSQLQIASARDVRPQVLEEGHGPTSSYQLLLGGIDSERDRIAAGRRVTSLYIIDFEPGGTNNAHRHQNAEEIYFMLQGHGEMVAGGADGQSQRYAAEAGDAFFFTRNSPVGFFSKTEVGEPHARILAVRSIYPEHASSGTSK